MPKSSSWRKAIVILLAALAGALIALSQAPPQADESVQLTPAPASVNASMLQTATAIAGIEPVEHNILRRPIELSDEYSHWVDRTYTYGSTQWQTRAVHLGVEFVNPRDTPVYAAKAGIVVFAGEDDLTLLGPQLDYYGKVVVVAHKVYSLAGRQVFTLYGHLEAIEVTAGQEVDDLDRLGQIGSSGVAIGPHLHFEIRVDDPFDYRMTRNPELWLQHYVGRGMIVGSMRDETGQRITGKRISVRSDATSREVFSYGSDIVNSDPVWNENFSVGDLPAGQYELVVLNDAGNVAYAETITVESYRTTFVEITLADS